MRLVTGTLLVVLSGLPSARATAGLMMSYEGDETPEEGGWARHVAGDGPLLRRADGLLTQVFVRDATGGGAESYARPTPFDLDPGLFVEWRAKALVMDSARGDGMHFSIRDANHAESLRFEAWRDETGEGWVYERASFNTGQRRWEIIPATSSDWHSFRIRFVGPGKFVLSVDGQEIFKDTFPVTFPHEAGDLTVSFGVESRSPATVTQWDYIRIGVIPEPATLALMLPLFLAARSRRRMRPR